MIKDIVPELLEKIQQEFQNNTAKSKILKAKIQALKSGKATHLDSNEFAVEVGKILADIFKNEITEGVLPDEKMYYNIAKRLIDPNLKINYDLVSDYSTNVQDLLNKESNISLKAIKPKLNQDRIDGIVNKISEYDDFEKGKWLLDEPIKNFTQSIVDDTIKSNTEFQYKSGLTPKIIRKEVGNCCPWCKAVVGVYEYPDVPKDIYRRHQLCRCIVEYLPGNGKKQDVHTKKWTDAERKNERVEIYSEDERKKSQKENLEKVKRKFLSEYDIHIDDEILELSPEVTLQAFDGIESMFKLYPDLKDQITNIGVSRLGIMNCNGHKINFNPAYFSDNKKLQETCSEASKLGWWPKNSSPTSVAVHEMGHAVNRNLITKNPSYEYDFERILDWSDETTAKKIVSEACKKTKKTEFGKGKTNAVLRNLQSRYGATKPAEAVAEAFADLYANKSNANPLSKAIVDEINLLFDEYGKGGK